ncbi:LutB/LldF family L-lactate oxidation iron-sulfur protein [Ferroacidibacillus organovorans]|uniref:Amino acid dehydrogenase n=1 Tax=Ferroacidibacillus organovorans TaxID=1765683 RepID=A0A853K8I9_9BACL|nr:LutB/LldF family L-lactate oxidation iron-sulfur protein [Ferroacidibacillus organovorans]KYP81772.1 amino acid dehydrogenase [Ferroacidibacillus organovorans]OAG93296.1 amino acid dehydrogenase [Ferroacidibacillus organovorans]
MNVPKEVDHSQQDLSERSHRALQDEFLRSAVRFTVDRLRSKKKSSTEHIPHWEDLREQGRAIRSHTIAHLDAYLGQFAKHVRAAGGQVHFATDAREANARVLEIVRQKEARSVIKSKSMVSEEIEVNHHLEAAGIDVVESDLGEYIIQLAGETPSHIIIPSIHKNREQIKDLFTADGGADLTTDTKVLASFARRRMRERFLQADIGMTGCNFGIAESGTIVLFTNEGNADMVANLPKTHIVLMGMERVLPSLADLEVIANLLPRSATGQKLTTYMSMITGTKRPSEVDGAQELHVIILDNGRSKQLGDEHFQEVLNCIRCGACLNVCPVYRQIGGHAYGSVYPGPIGAVLTPLLEESDAHDDLPYASSLCGACYEACPVKIPLHEMLVKLRQRKVRAGKTSPQERALMKGFAWGFGNHRRYRLMMKAGRLVQMPLVKKGQIDAAFGPLSAWTASRAAPMLVATSFRERWPSLEQTLTANKGDDKA